jgi:hypothetical protein
MGLDQYAYVALKERERDSYYEAEYGDDESKRGTVVQPREIAYWRKHPNLQGWMEQLWIEKGRPGGGSGQEDNWGSGFNGVELELTWKDIDRLEQDVLEGKLPHTQGFFFGNSSDDHYREHDLEFCRNARAELFLGLKVFYNSSW